MVKKVKHIVFWSWNIPGLWFSGFYCTIIKAEQTNLIGSFAEFSNYLPRKLFVTKCFPEEYKQHRCLNKFLRLPCPVSVNYTTNNSHPLGKDLFIYSIQKYWNIQLCFIFHIWLDLSIQLMLILQGPSNICTTVHRIWMDAIKYFSSLMTFCVSPTHTELGWWHTLDRRLKVPWQDEWPTWFCRGMQGRSRLTMHKH